VILRARAAGHEAVAEVDEAARRDKRHKQGLLESHQCARRSACSSTSVPGGRVALAPKLTVGQEGGAGEEPALQAHAFGGWQPSMKMGPSSPRMQPRPTDVDSPWRRQGAADDEVGADPCEVHVRPISTQGGIGDVAPRSRSAATAGEM